MNLKRLGIGCLGVTVGAAAAVGWIATVALAVDLQPLAIAVAAAAAGLSWATWRVHRRLETITPRWDAAIREAIATLPKGTRVRRSKAGRGSPLTVLAMTIYVIGLFVAVPWAIVAPSHEGAGAPIWLVAGPGVVTGVLLAMARDGRLRRVEIGTVLALPATVTFILIALATGGEGALDFGALVPSLLLVVLVASVPVLVGFGIPRALAWLYRSSRPIEASPPPAPSAALLPELEAATDHRRATAVVRMYLDSKQPVRLLREDQQALAGAGYQLVAICERPYAGEGGAIRLNWLPGDAEAATVALFVRYPPLRRPTSEEPSGA